MPIKRLALSLVLCVVACAATDGLAQSLNHVVLVWLKDPGNEAQIDAIIDNVGSLTAIPGVLAVSAGRAIPSERTIVDDSFTVGVNIVLGSTDDIADYVKHPIHTEYIGKYIEGKAARILIYDFYTGEE